MKAGEKLFARRAAGFGLIELLFVLILLAAFTVIFEELFMANYRAETGAIRGNELIHRVDAAMDMLRRDVWNARRVRAVPGGGVAITTSGGDEVNWNADAADWKRAPAGGAGAAGGAGRPILWKEMPGLRFEVNRALVTAIVTTAATRGNPAVEERMVFCVAGQLAGGVPAADAGGGP